MSRIVLAAEAAADIERCIREARGHEICGFLLSAANGVQCFHRVRNLAKEPRAFFVSTMEADRVARSATARHFEVSAFVHSHPRNLDLSQGDLTFAEDSPLTWIIVALVEGRLEYQVHESMKHG